ncbi:hypothetical protein GLYMA_16G044950v4 [Glycine max]|nr:hypothetical protein GLYMA_16G044950v4 [Glycine max]KAH1149964.1 hypothetical protein GYH30_044132 [Glycine max]
MQHGFNLQLLCNLILMSNYFTLSVRLDVKRKICFTFVEDCLMV